LSVHRTADGRWFSQWRDKNSGKVKKKYFGRGLSAEAAARSEDEARPTRPWQRRTPQRVSPYFFELVNEYLAAKSDEIAATTLDLMIGKMRAVILPELGRLPAIRISAAALDTYVARRLKTVKRTTVHRELSDIQAVLNWAAAPDRKLITHNPVARYKKPRRDDAVISPPTAAEAEAILRKCAPHVVRAICLAYYTGLRPGRSELLGLRWSAVDWEEHTLHIVSARKGGAAFRSVPLHAQFVQQLNNWRAEDLATYGDDPAYHNLIVHWRGRPVKRIVKAFRAAVVRAKIGRRLRPYDFRHLFATAILRSGGDLKSTSELLGHSRTDTTTRIYQHTNRELHRATVDKLPILRLPRSKKTG